MKTVWIINHYAQTPAGPGGTRHYQLAKALQKYGWVAHIIGASTEYSTGRQRLLRSENARVDDVDQIKFLWLNTPPYRGNGIGRIANMLVFSAKLLGKAPSSMLPRPDVIIGSSVHPFAVLSAECLARRFRVPFVFEVRDLWPQTLIDFGLIRNKSVAAILLRALEGYLYRRATAIITLLPLARLYIQRFGISSDHIHWIPNGVDLAAWPQTQIKEASASSPFTLMYLGAFGQANALDVLILAMHELRQRPNSPGIQVRLIGDGPLRPDLINMAARLNLFNISFENPVPKNAVPALAQQADVFWASIIDSPLYQYGISLNKIYDYLAAARPVIFGCSASNNPVRAAGAGLTVAPGDSIALADAICQLASASAVERRQMGLAGRAYVERMHDSDMLGQRLASILDCCLAMKCSTS